MARPAEPVPRGFTLIELAVSLAIVGLLLGMFALPALNLLRHRTGTAAFSLRADDAVAALEQFAIEACRLPCPARAGGAAGTEDKGACTGIGILPWRTLGLPYGHDRHGNLYSYVVSPAYAEAGGLHGNPTASIQFRPLPEPASYTPVTVAAALISHGPNGHGAWGRDGRLRPMGMASVSEAQQLSESHSDSVYAGPFDVEPGFDDEVVVLPALIIRNLAYGRGHCAEKADAKTPAQAGVVQNR